MSDLQEKPDLDASPAKFVWHVADTDYSTRFFLVRCQEHEVKLNKDGLSDREVGEQKQAALTVAMQKFTMALQVRDFRKGQLENEAFNQRISELKALDEPGDRVQEMRSLRDLIDSSEESSTK